MEESCQQQGFLLSDFVLLTILLSPEECVHGGRGEVDADLGGRVTATPFTMVTRRNLYARGMGRSVVFYQGQWRLFF